METKEEQLHNLREYLRNHKSLNQLRDLIHENAKSKGFYDKPREVGTMLMLIVSELAEAMEADRKDKKVNRTWMELFDKGSVKFEDVVKDTFEDELADALIRILDLCGYMGIDIEKHVELKMKYNNGREFMHGKKY